MLNTLYQYEKYRMNYKIPGLEGTEKAGFSEKVDTLWTDTN